MLQFTIKNKIQNSHKIKDAAQNVINTQLSTTYY